jgi:23S rRNA pseudouridine2605 synthase
MNAQKHGLARWISKYGLMSRTAAERLVLSGRVTVNGRKATDPDRPSHPGLDRILVDGRPLRPARAVYLALHKPRGTITTARDPQGRPTVYQLLPPGAERAQAVGRLDADSSGLLLFTNDTELAARITNSSSGIEKVYRARLQGRLRTEDGRRFEEGVELDGRATRRARCRLLSTDAGTSEVEVVLTEGRNRQVRRMWDALGYPVLSLLRTRIGPVELGRLPPGRTRPLSEMERRLLGAPS